MLLEYLIIASMKKEGTPLRLMESYVFMILISEASTRIESPLGVLDHGQCRNARSLNRVAVHGHANPVYLGEGT